MKNSLSACLALMGMFGGQAPAKDNEGDRKTLYFFFSEKTSPAPEMAKAINAYLAKGRDDIALLPALLVEDWNTFLKVGETSPLYQTIRQLGKITPVQVFDEEALKLATAWKITRLPAVVIVARRRAHVLQGAAAGLEEIFGCAQ